MKPTSDSIHLRTCNTSTTVELNTLPGTEDAAIAKGWYPKDGGVAGTDQVEVKKPAWLKTEEKSAK